MAEQTLSELVMNLINWVESLHETNLKYEAQVEKLSRDLAEAQNSNQELEARVSQLVYTNGSNKAPIINQQPANIIVHQQPICQPIATPSPLVAPPTQILWYGPNSHEIQTPYYDPHASTAVYAYPQP